MTRVLLIILMTALTTRAELEWAEKKATLQVHPTQTSAEAVFDFTNTGDHPVSISDINITCGCLSAQPVNDSYEPGETGQLVVRFNLQGRKGMQHKHVEVTTSDGQRADLNIVTDIPEAYQASTSILLWKKGDDAKQKVLRLTNPNEKPIKLFSITSSLKELPAELTAIRDGFEYEITVTRNTDKSNVRSVIRIETEAPPGMTESKTLKYYVIAQ